MCDNDPRSITRSLTPRIREQLAAIGRRAAANAPLHRGPLASTPPHLVTPERTRADLDRLYIDPNRPVQHTDRGLVQP